MARSRWRMRAAVGVVCVVALLVALVAADLAANAGRVHRGVRVGGVALGGVRRVDVPVHLERELAVLAAEPVVLNAAGKNVSVTATQVALSYETTPLAEAAYGYGRSGDVLRDVRDRALAWIGGAELGAKPKANPERVAAVIAALAREVDVSAKNAEVVLGGASVSVRPSSAGRTIDQEQAKRLLIAAFADKDRTVDVPISTAAPEVDDTAAKAAAADAREMLSSGVEIAFDNKRWTFTPAQIAKWIAFKRGSEALPSDAGVPAQSDTGTAQDVPAGDQGSAGPASRLQAYVDPAKARPLIMSTIGAVGRPARDATFKVAAGSVGIVPSQDGIGPDVEALARELTVVLKDAEATRSVALRTHRVAPKITTASAQTMGIRERISRYTTNYSAGNRPRVANIHTLANAIDGTLIEPGGTFSFNGTVGPRTAEKGYQEANAIVDGKLVPQLGGGICQVGTTLFNTVFESGLPVVERHNHSFYISHYPKGRDATVSWGGPDFKFRNDTDHWILLVTAYSDSSLSIALYGTNPGYTVESLTGAWENEKPFPSEATKDPTLPQGARVVEDGGVTGRSCTVKRIVRKNGVIVRTDSFRSVYHPKPEVVRVGTKPVPSKVATTVVSPAP
jgi:vancomycin resistance protein YoaR